MKLQYLIIIFIIIAIPMILLLTYYMSLQKATLDLQTTYDTKFITSTKQALEAFEVNTVEWDKGFSRYSDSKRRDILASINVFKTSFANSLNLTGLERESILNYIPAIMYNLYDGFYIYTPTSVPMTKNNNNGIQLFQDGNSNNATTDAVDINGDMNKILYVAETGGTTFSYQYIDDTNNTVNETIQGLTTNINNAKKEYKHILKTYISYSEKIGLSTICYSLDNFIKVYTKNNAREGYLIDTSKLTDTSGAVPLKTGKLKYKDTIINPEELSEQIYYYNSDGTVANGMYKYVYNMYNEKCYYDSSHSVAGDSHFFKLINNKKIYLKISRLKDCEFKVLYILNNDTEVIKLYQPLNNSTDDSFVFFGDDDMINSKDELKIGDMILLMRKYSIFDWPDSILNPTMDFSAINYYMQSYAFTNWVKSLNLGSDFNISSTNDPEDENSPFNKHKKEIMKKIITDNLNLAISSYSARRNNQFSLPIFTYQDWEQILHNISMTTFVQGIPIGLKNYNNYVIAISSNNKEYLNPDEIYYISNVPDYYYHFKDCDKVQGQANNIIGYRNVDFVMQSFENTYNYYKHATARIAGEKCYYCLISKNNPTTSTDLYKRAYLHAIARERYIQKK